MFFFLTIPACTGPDAEPPTLDQVAWLADLQAHRPELMSQHGDSVRDPAWQALVIRPAWRAEILKTAATYASVLAREYTPALRAQDATWAEAMRAGQRAFQPTPTLFPAGYPIEVYVGYQIGEHRAPMDADGYSFKVFFELDDFLHSLTAVRYLGFSEALDRAGFIGDSKIDLRPGQVRYQYNNVIVHAPSAAMAQCAESVGLAYFGPAVLHRARGIDAPPIAGEKPTDWHHFLLRGGFSRLPPEKVAFVQYRSPPAECPKP